MADDDDAPAMLGASEAAELLGVSRATLYAYVSRGLIASEPGPGPSRARRYPRASLEGLRERRARRREPAMAAHGALHWGGPVLDSRLCLIEGGRLFYGGRDVVALAAAASFEEAAALLWTGSTDAAGRLFSREPSDGAGGPEPAALARRLLADGERAVGGVAALGEAAPRRAAAVLEGLFAAAGARGRGPLGRRLARGWSRPSAAADLTAALVLCADHDLNVSAFTARCVASADAPLESALLAAMCALRGRRHGGMTERVEGLLDEAARGEPREAVARALREQGAVPGFGHELYPAGDPRGAELLRRARAAADDAAREGVVEVGRRELGLEPTLDLGLVALARAHRLPGGAALCLFALGRSAGWAAHAMEAAADARLIRPRSRYTGPRPGAPMG
jgi:citrate synthase